MNGYCGTAKVEIVSTFFRNNENDLLTLKNFPFLSLKFNQG